MRRLNKYITDAGYCSRREADRYIEQGRVTVNGRIAGLGDMVGETDTVEVDGERVGRRTKAPIYIAFNKPVGVTCTTDRSDKTNIVDFIGYKERIFPVGRLDKDSEGLIILTNDGDIVNRILRAGNNNPKEYIVTVDKPVTPEFLSRMAAGVHILGVKTKPCEVRRKNEKTFVIFLTQGLNRQIRRMCRALDYKVVRLKRVRVINITLGSLEPGRWRYFTPEETAGMQAVLAGSSGTEAASNERKASLRRTSKGKKSGSYSEYRSRGKSADRSKTAGDGSRTPITRRAESGKRAVKITTAKGKRSAGGSRAKVGAAKAVSPRGARGPKKR
ncbi:MAG: pseudouridine synthase [Alistipes sp.]|nr:pseudouridine synthase [Alistipes sp.]